MLGKVTNANEFLIYSNNITLMDPRRGRDPRLQADPRLQTPQTTPQQFSETPSNSPDILSQSTTPEGSSFTVSQAVVETSAAQDPGTSTSVNQATFYQQRPLFCVVCASNQASNYC